MIEISERMEQLRQLLGAAAFRFNGETQLQDGIEQVLQQAGVPYQREYQIDDRNRLDFMVEGIALEVKVKGSRLEAARQCYRYQKLAAVQGVMLLAVTHWAQTVMLPESDGTPLMMIKLKRAW